MLFVFCAAYCKKGKPLSLELELLWILPDRQSWLRQSILKESFLFGRIGKLNLQHFQEMQVIIVYISSFIWAHTV